MFMITCSSVVVWTLRLPLDCSQLFVLLLLSYGTCCFLSACMSPVPFVQADQFYVLTCMSKCVCELYDTLRACECTWHDDCVDVFETTPWAEECGLYSQSLATVTNNYLLIGARMFNYSLSGILTEDTEYTFNVFFKDVVIDTAHFLNMTSIASNTQAWVAATLSVSCACACEYHATDRQLSGSPCAPLYVGLE